MSEQPDYVKEAMAKACQHPVVQFNSGDYYVACESCDARWGRITWKQHEYGEDKDGNPVGCAPGESNQGFCDPDHRRHRTGEGI